MTIVKVTRPFRARREQFALLKMKADTFTSTQEVGLVVLMLVSEPF